MFWKIAIVPSRRYNCLDVLNSNTNLPIGVIKITFGMKSVKVKMTDDARKTILDTKYRYMYVDELEQEAHMWCDALVYDLKCRYGFEITNEDEIGGYFITLAHEFHERNRVIERT